MVTRRLNPKGVAHIAVMLFLCALFPLMSSPPVSLAEVGTTITPSALPSCPGPCGVGVTIVTPLPPTQGGTVDDHWRGQAGERAQSVPQLRTVRRRDRRYCEFLQRNRSTDLQHLESRDGRQPVADLWNHSNHRFSRRQSLSDESRRRAVRSDCRIGPGGSNRFGCKGTRILLRHDGGLSQPRR